ncbi:hypothetical protein Pan2_60 [Pseudanabaena phage Pan2]|nr:hypothetical protein Pan2_60 [Pseudanabaena phage Pan2]
MRDPLMVDKPWGIGHVADMSGPTPLTAVEQGQVSADLESLFGVTSMGGPQ